MNLIVQSLISRTSTQGVVMRRYVYHGTKYETGDIIRIVSSVQYLPKWVHVGETFCIEDIIINPSNNVRIVIKDPNSQVLFRFLPFKCVRPLTDSPPLTPFEKHKLNPTFCGLIGVIRNEILVEFNNRMKEEQTNKEVPVEHKFVAIKHEGSTSKYTYRTIIKDLEEKDLIVGESVNGLVAGRVVEYIDKDDVDVNKNWPWVVAKVDESAYVELMDKIKRHEKLITKMKDRQKKLEGMATYKLLAKGDAEMAEYLKEIEAIEA